MPIAYTAEQSYSCIYVTKQQDNNDSSGFISGMQHVRIPANYPNLEILYFHLQRLNNRGMGMEIGEIKLKKLFEICWLI